jgi:hypothetical protein
VRITRLRTFPRSAAAFVRGSIVPFKQVVNRALREGLDALRRPKRRRSTRQRTFRMGNPLVPDLDRAHSLAAALEDDEIARKVELRK